MAEILPWAMCATALVWALGKPAVMALAPDSALARLMGAPDPQSPAE